MSLSLSGIKKEQQTLEWARFVRSALTPAEPQGFHPRIIEKIATPGVYHAQSSWSPGAERPLSAAEIVRNFAKEALPTDPLERYEVADALVLLKQRIKTHYYDENNWGRGRFVLAIFFSYVRFENSEIGRQICTLESQLNCAENLQAHETYLREYIQLRGITLPNGRFSSVAELEESLRVHWLSMPYEKLLEEKEKYMPKLEYSKQAVRIFEQTAATHFRSLSVEKLMLVKITPFLRPVYVQILKAKILEQIKHNGNRLILEMNNMLASNSQTLNPYFMEAVVECLKQCAIPLEEVALYGPLDDAAIEQLKPHLGKIKVLRLGNGITDEGASHLLEHCKDLYNRGEYAPESIHLFLSGHNFYIFHDESEAVEKESAPLHISGADRPLWLNIAKKGRLLVAQFDRSKRSATQEKIKWAADFAAFNNNVPQSNPAKETEGLIHKHNPGIDVGPTTRVGKKLDLTDIEEQDKGVLWARFLQQSLYDDGAAILFKEKRRHLYVYKNNLRPEEFMLSLYNELKPGPGYTRLTSHDVVALSSRLWKAPSVEEDKTCLQLKTRLKTRYYSGLVGYGRWLLALFFSKIRFENSTLGLPLCQKPSALPAFDPTGQVDSKVLFAYAKQAGIYLPMGWASSKEELEDAIRAHCLNLTFSQFVVESLYIPAELMNVYNVHLERAAKYYFTSMSRQLNMVSVFANPCTDDVRALLLNIYKEALTKNINEQIEQTQAIYFSGGLRVGSEIFMPVLIDCIQKMPVPRLKSLCLEDMLSDDLLKPLFPLLSKVESLSLNRGRISHQMVMQLINQILVWRQQGLPVPTTITYTHEGDRAQAQPLVWEVRLPKGGVKQEVLLWLVHQYAGLISLMEKQSSPAVSKGDVRPFHRINRPDRVPRARGHVNVLEKRFWNTKVNEFQLRQEDIKQIESVSAYLKELDPEASDESGESNPLHRLAKLMVHIQACYTPENREKIQALKVPEFLLSRHQEWLKQMSSL